MWLQDVLGPAMMQARRDPKEEHEEEFGGEGRECHQVRLDHRLVHQALVLDQLGLRKVEENSKE